MRRPTALRAITVIGVAAIGLGATACTDGAARAGDGDPTVGVAFFPIADMVEQMDLPVRTVVLVPPGQEAHEYDPTPKDLTRLEDAAAFFYLGQGFQPNVESAMGS